MGKAMHHYLRQTASIVAHVLLVLTVLRFFVLDIGTVDGQSMEPLFRDNAMLLVNKLGAFFVPLKRGDVVQFFPPGSDDRLLIKRVIGLPGETVIVKRNKIFIRSAVNGSEVTLLEPYLPSDTLIDVRFDQPNIFFVPASSYFLLGDNRPFSGDSREFGPVHRKRIVGAIFKF